MPTTAFPVRSPLHERPEGRRLLEDAGSGAFTTLLVYRLDRLGRSLLVIVDAHDRLQAAGVSLRSATEPIDTSSPSGRLIFQMLASFAEYDRENIRERTRAGLHRAFRNGKHSGRIPYGYYGVDGRLDTCIILRTALLKGGAAYFQAGGGVVAYSVPSLEYEETRNKAGAMVRALEVARSRGMWL